MSPSSALAPDNFEVRVDDTLRHPVSLQFVDARGDERRAPDVSPAGDSPRLGRRFVFVVDRESMPFGHGPQVFAAAGQFIDAFAPGDHAAVWILSNASGRLTFTHDRAVLKKSPADADGIAQSPPDDVRLAPGENCHPKTNDERHS